MIGGQVDCVIQSRFASRIDVVQRIDQIANTAGEVLFQVCRIIEVHDERFVIRIALANKRQRGAIHALALVSHASAVVDDQSETQRDIFMPERLDGLRNLILEDLKVLFRQPVYRPAFLVENGNGQLHFERFNAQRVAFILVVFLGLSPLLREQAK